MEKLLQPYDKECMRMAMLKHEETFREQVYELHRLYRIQKILMQNISSNTQIGQQQSGWNFKNSSTKYQMVDLERPADQDNNNNNNNNAEKMIETVDESELELTLGPSSFSRRRMTAAAAERPLPSDSVPNFSSSSTGSSHIVKRTSTDGLGISFHQKMSSGNYKSEVDEHHLRQDIHRLNNNNNINNNSPPWLFQVLRLNVT